MTTQINARMIEGLSSHPPQAIIKAQRGARPSGWVESDCDAPVESMSFSGNDLTVKSGLQVAFADTGVVRLSTELVSPLIVDMTDKGNGTHHVFVGCAEDGEITSAGTTEIAPSVGSGRSSVTVQDALTIVSSVNATNPAYAIDGDVGTAATVPDNLTGHIVFEKDHVGPCTLKMLSNDTYTNTFRVSVSSDGVSFTTLPTIYSLLKNTWTEYAIQTSCKFIKLEGYGNPGGAFCVIRDLQSYTPVQAGGDFYDVAAVTMRDGNDMPIRRVYLGTVVKGGGIITSVHCYYLGTGAKFPVNNGNSCTANQNYYVNQPFPGPVDALSEVYSSVHTDFIQTLNYYSSSGGVYFGNKVVRSVPEYIHVRTKTYLAGVGGDGQDMTVSRIRLVARRGY